MDWIIFGGIILGIYYLAKEQKKPMEKQVEKEKITPQGVDSILKVQTKLLEDAIIRNDPEARKKLSQFFEENSITQPRQE